LWCVCVCVSVCVVCVCVCVCGVSMCLCVCVVCVCVCGWVGVCVGGIACEIETSAMRRLSSDLGRCATKDIIRLVEMTVVHKSQNLKRQNKTLGRTWPK